MANTPAIWWVRRDLRLADNQALVAALSSSDKVIPVFVLDATLLRSRWVGETRTAFLIEGLRALDGDLRAIGSRLIVRAGEPVAEIARLRAETGSGAVYAERDYTPYARRRDAQAGSRFPLHLCEGITLSPPEELVKENGAPYTVFTPFSRRWKANEVPTPRDLLDAPASLSSVESVASIPLPERRRLAIGFEAGEAEGRRRLNEFVAGDSPAIYDYGLTRNRLDLAGTSRLSPYLRFGMVSPREVVVAASSAIEAAVTPSQRSSAEAWLNEVVWREFYQSTLFHFPHVRTGAFRREYEQIAWRNDRADFDAWCEGRTGYPVVDAAMRQLRSTGWMHNRARMIVASFLVKDLLIDWRWGEAWFMQHLVDGDPASNNGGWQWSAGTGTDAAPYFRIFNPTTQGAKFDPDGEYVRTWVPELANLPATSIHTPWHLTLVEQLRLGCHIAVDYPAPIVDHAAARERTLAAFRAVRP